MGAETIGRPRIELGVDPAGVKTGVDGAVEAFKAGQARIGAEQAKIEQAQARVARSIQQSMDRISAVKASGQLQIISQALDQIGGAAKLTDAQIKNLAADVERLAAAGGRVPKNLQNLVPAGPGLKGVGGQALQAEAQSAAASLGPLGTALTALGPAGLVAAGGVAAATAGFGLAAKAASDFLARAGQLSDLSDRTGLGTEFLQRLDAAGQQVGVSLDDSANAVFKLQKTIGEAEQGSKKAAQALEDIGVSLEDLKGKTPEEQFKIVATALATIKDQEQFVAAGTDVMGKTFASVAALIRSDFIPAMDRAVTISGEQIKAADEVGDAFTRLGQAGDALKLQLGAAVLQSVTGDSDAVKAIDGITAAIARLAGAASSPVVQTTFRAILAGATFGFSESLRDAGAGAAQGESPEEAQAKRLAEAQKAAQAARTAAAQAAAKERNERANAAAEQKKQQEEAIRLQREFIADQSASIRGIDQELAKRREQRESFSLLGKSAADASVDQGLLASQVERFGGVTALSDTQLKKLVTDLQSLSDAGGSNAFGMSTLADAQAEVERRSASLAKNQFGLAELGKVIPESTGLWTRYGDVVEQEEENAAAAADVVNEKLARQISILAGLDVATSALGHLSSLLNDAGVSAESGLGKVVSGLENVAHGAQEGAAIGGLFGPEGALIGAVGGALVTGIGSLVSGDSPAEKAAKDVGSRLGVTISDSLAQAIGEDAERVGDGVAASLLHLSDIIEEAGGVATFGFDKATAAAHDLFSQIETGKLTVQEAGDEFDKVFTQLIPDAIDKGTGLAKQSFLDLIELNQRFGTESQAVAGFLSQQNDAVVAGLEAVAAGAEVTADSAAGLGAAVAAAFQNIRDSGATPGQAFDQLQKVIEGLRQKFKDAGVDGGAAFDSLAAQSALLTDKVAGPLIAAIDGAAQAAVGLANSNALTPEIFEGLQATIGQTFDKLVQEGHGGAQALALIAPDLQRIFELQQRFGFSVDESTQNLIDQGVAAGLVGEQHESAQERIASGVEKLNTTVAALAKVFGVILPEEAESGAERIQRALDGIHAPDIGIDVGGDPVRGRPPREFAGGLDEGPMLRDGYAFLHAGERVFRPDQVDRIGGNQVDVGGVTVVVQGSVDDPQAMGVVIADRLAAVLNGHGSPALEREIASIK